MLDTPLTSGGSSASIEPYNQPVELLNLAPVLALVPASQELSSVKNVQETRERRPNPRYAEYYAHMAMTQDLYFEPKTYEEAINCFNRDYWIAAMQEEYESLMDAGTWELQDLPKSHSTVSYKWVFKLKLNGDGSIERYKARLVARGFSQRQKIDYHEIYSPVVKFPSIWTILSIATASGMNIIQFDVRPLIYMEK